MLEKCRNPKVCFGVDMEAQNDPKDGKVMDIDPSQGKPSVYRMFLRCP